MPNWETIDIMCDAEQCQFSWDDMIEREHRDDTYICPMCDGPAHRCISIPNVTRVSYHDGYRRGAAYEEMKQIARLKKARVDIHHNKRQDVDKEIRERQAVASRAAQKVNATKGDR